MMMSASARLRLPFRRHTLLLKVMLVSCTFVLRIALYSVDSSTASPRVIILHGHGSVCAEKKEVLVDGCQTSAS